MSNNNTTAINTTFSSDSIIVVLGSITNRFVYNLPVVFIILGVIGFIGNAFTFLQPKFRYNACCIYSLLGSFVDVINLLTNLLTTYLRLRYDIGTSWLTVSSLCKVNIFFIGFLPQLSINVLVLSVIDRFACTCSLTSFLRQLNKPKMTPWMIVITILITAITSIRATITYDIIPGTGCGSTQTIVNIIFYSIFNGALQPVIMIIFILLTYRNILKSGQRVGAIQRQNTSRGRNQFIIMIFVQAIVTTNNIKTTKQIYIEVFVFILTNIMYYFNNVKSFYLSTLTCRPFRQTFIKAFLKICFQLSGKRREGLMTNGNITNIITVTPQNRLIIHKNNNM
ncbi:unnamed protein product [Adineta steineri]|uniref:G-protein coupled receptors family 1 profile domain-containing protein n=1 Tax=Adineta steineri TaxID=433720 RepID=A0A818QK26_9BILA|nr:unnamed protein product [Adineta steineri]CAF3642215.1 unnamed protein product [Adineta steineri]